MSLLVYTLRALRLFLSLKQSVAIPICNLMETVHQCERLFKQQNTQINFSHRYLSLDTTRGTDSPTKGTRDACRNTDAASTTEDMVMLSKNMNSASSKHTRALVLGSLSHHYPLMCLFFCAKYFRHTALKIYWWAYGN
jgi:hypothetical protein